MKANCRFAQHECFLGARVFFDFFDADDFLPDVFLLFIKANVKLCGIIKLGLRASMDRTFHAISPLDFL